MAPPSGPLEQCAAVERLSFYCSPDPQFSNSNRPHRQFDSLRLWPVPLGSRINRTEPRVTVVGVGTGRGGCLGVSAPHRGDLWEGWRSQCAPRSGEERRSGGALQGRREAADAGRCCCSRADGARDKERRGRGRRLGGHSETQRGPVVMGVSVRSWVANEGGKHLVLVGKNK